MNNDNNNPVVYQMIIYPCHDLDADKLISLIKKNASDFVAWFYSHFKYIQSFNKLSSTNME